MNPCGPELSGPARPACIDTAIAVNDEHDDRHDERAETRELHLLRLYLLAEILRCSPDHQAADEHGDDGVDQDRVEPAAAATRGDLAEHHSAEQTKTTDWVELVIRGVSRPRRGAGGRHTEQRGRRVAESGFFAFGVPHGGMHTGGDDGRVVLVLGVAGEAHPDPEDDHHRGEQGRAVADASHHLAERVREGKRDRQK